MDEVMDIQAMVDKLVGEGATLAESFVRVARELGVSAGEVEFIYTFSETGEGDLVES